MKKGITAIYGLSSIIYEQTFVRIAYNIRKQASTKRLIKGEISYRDQMQLSGRHTPAALRSKFPSSASTSLAGTQVEV